VFEIQVELSASVLSGQEAEDPVQVALKVHGEFCVTHWYEEGWKESVGHVPSDPEQVSSISQPPAKARHVVPTVTNPHCAVQQKPGSPLFTP